MDDEMELPFSVLARAPFELSSLTFDPEVQSYAPEVASEHSNWFQQLQEQSYFSAPFQNIAGGLENVIVDDVVDVTNSKTSKIETQAYCEVSRQISPVPEFGDEDHSLSTILSTDFLDPNLHQFNVPEISSSTIQALNPVTSPVFSVSNPTSPTTTPSSLLSRKAQSPFPAKVTKAKAKSSPKPSSKTKSSVPLPLSSASSSDLTEEEKKEKNRVAAFKYREKKRSEAAESEKRLTELQQEQSRLREAIQFERTKISEIRELLVKHGLLPAS